MLYTVTHQLRLLALAGWLLTTGTCIPNYNVLAGHPIKNILSLTVIFEIRQQLNAK